MPTIDKDNKETATRGTPLLKRLALFFAAGAVLGSVFDGMHANHDVLAYLPSEVMFARLAWWVPPEFGAGGLLAGLAPWMIPPSLFRPLASPIGSDKPSKRVAWTQLAAALAIYGASSVLPYYARLSTGTTSAVLGLMFGGTWFATNRRPAALAACAVVGLAGSGWEALLCALGKFRYVHPDALGGGLVTHWIFWIWAGAALGGAHLAACYTAPFHLAASKAKREEESKKKIEL
ncbi:hypothetical protein BC828DRAFT_393674 [Blastocladiella britannica]|nr:hypothetical protein BC828DRAFT_393674 [Blastocladiella britannica]